MFPDYVNLINSPVFTLLTEPVAIHTQEGVKEVAGLLSERLIGGHDFIENDSAEGELSEWVVEHRRGEADAQVGDIVVARGMRFTIVDIGQDICGNVRLVLRR